jgi:hypothetical protein
MNDNQSNSKNKNKNTNINGQYSGPLLTIGQDAKTVKGEKFGFRTGIQYLAPVSLSGALNTCPWASNGCQAACLFTAGMAGIYKSITKARINRTQLFAKNRPIYFKQLIAEIEKLVIKARRENVIPVVRLNGTSDIAWEKYLISGTEKTIFETFPGIQFYDYTKGLNRMLAYLSGKFPSNYQLTFSRSESNDVECAQVLAAGGNIAVVFSSDKLPETYLGYVVKPGDDSDLRFLDPKNVVVGLYAKGKAKKDTSGFVVATT